MPMYGPPRLKRRRIGYGRRNTMGAAGRKSYAGRVLRSIGAPAMAHTFARPGQRLRLTNDGLTYYINGSTLGSSVAGGLYGIALGGVTGAAIRGANDFGLSEFFQFSFLNASGDLANLYDNYRIKAVKVKFDLSFNSVPGDQTSGTGGSLPFAPNSLPMVHYCVDPDDNTPPTSVADVLQYSKSRSVRLGDKSLTITLSPRAQGVVSSNPVSSTVPITPAVGSMLPMNTWLDCQNAQTVPHFGLKMFVENMPVGTGTGANQWNWVLTMTPVYILECKNVH